MLGMVSTPSPERLHELFDLDHATGVLTWRTKRGSAAAGSVAGTPSARNGLVVRVDKVLRSVHQIVWCMHHGASPRGLLRHINGDKTDNRVSNLKAVTKAEAAAHLRASPITPGNVHDVLLYDAGLLRWRHTLTGSSRIAGEVAGHTNEQGYIVIETGGKTVAAHRIVWLMHHGRWPLGEIDHLNGIRDDNRIENLRDVGRRTNTENRRKASSRSATGELGVSMLPSGRYRARIRSVGHLHELGIFDSIDDAKKAYVSAKRRLHAGCTI